MKKMMFSAAMIIVLSFQVFAQNASLKAVEYKIGKDTFSGFYAAGKPESSGVVIIHQWMGISDHEKNIAGELNNLGYSVFVADFYGKGKTPKNVDEAKALAGTFYQDRQKFRDRGNAAVKKFVEVSKIKEENIFVIGYCFGGTAALELGRSGAPVKGLVALHGGLANPKPEDDANIKGKILVLHGAEDQSVSIEDVTKMIASFRQFKKDFSVHIFSDAVHGFTHKNDSTRYNEKADKRSWKIMLDFFAE